MKPRYILALDQGTTSSRAILFSRDGQPVASEQREFAQIYPRAGWVEHDPEAIWDTQLRVAERALAKAEISPEQIAAIGITNQRETTIVWDRRTGKPVHNAIVWQCRRTARMCDELKKQGLVDVIQRKTGLVLDAYFSATKLKWILDSVPGARTAAERGDLLFGTVDVWLLWQLTEGRVHATDAANAARTMLFNIHERRWDDELLDLFGIPAVMLPQVRPNSCVLGETALLGGTSLPITGMAGDQQAALFGQACYAPGSAKNTYGTGCFLLMNTGTEAATSTNQMLTTIAWTIDDQTTYALEGSVFMGGATIQWLRDELGMIRTAAESESLARQIPDSDGVYLVPAFVGLGAPYWDMEARGTIVGLTRGCGRAHFARAALEAIAYQTRDVIEAMNADAGIPLAELRVDGGATANNVLMQFQADILGVNVLRPSMTETTALGAAFLAGLAVGYWPDLESLAELWRLETEFAPTMDPESRRRHCDGWRRAVAKSRM